MNFKKNCLKIWKKTESVITAVDLTETDVLDHAKYRSLGGSDF